MTSNEDRAVTRAAKEFAVSAAAATMSHVLHHPLYTLKSQMMFHGPRFRFREFFGKAFSKEWTFLYRGKSGQFFFAIRCTLRCTLRVRVGLVSRSIGIMPEKALKMQAWIQVGRIVDRVHENATLSKWIIAGSAAGAATTIVGKNIYC